MTEIDWLACTDPQKMLSCLSDRASDRKLRLFALACIRRHHSLLDQESLDAITVAERLAEGLASPDERKQTRRVVLNAVRRLDTNTTDRRALAKAAVCWSLARRPHRAALKAAEYARQIGVLGKGGMQADAFEKTQCGWKTTDWTSSVREQVLLQVSILHDLFDDLFHSVVIEPNWRTAEVLSLAQAIYELQAFDRLPALADALATAGCDNDQLLSHCRSGLLHYRGCWAVDVVLRRS